MDPTDKGIRKCKNISERSQRDQGRQEWTAVWDILGAIAVIPGQCVRDLVCLLVCRSEGVCLCNLVLVP